MEDCKNSSRKSVIEIGSMVGVELSGLGPGFNSTFPDKRRHMYTTAPDTQA